MGFSVSKCKGRRAVLIARQGMVSHHVTYLREMMRNGLRSQSYADESCVLTHYAVKKCCQHDTDPGVMVNSNAGQTATDAYARGQIGFVGGAELIMIEN
jgi:hypothetical protein